MAAGSTVSRCRVQRDVPAGSRISDVGAGPDDEALTASVGALGSQPLPLQEWPAPPGTASVRRRRNMLPAIALLGSAVTVIAAGLVVVAGGPPRRATAIEPRALPAAPAIETERVRAERLPRRPSEPYRAAIHGHERELHRCARDHGEAFPPDAEAVIVVGVDGRAKHVVLQPDSAEHSELGSCIRGVLQVVRFPPSADEKEVAVGLAVYR